MTKLTVISPVKRENIFFIKGVEKTTKNYNSMKNLLLKIIINWNLNMLRMQIYLPKLKHFNFVLVLVLLETALTDSTRDNIDLSLFQSDPVLLETALTDSTRDNIDLSLF